MPERHGTLYSRTLAADIPVLLAADTRNHTHLQLTSRLALGPACCRQYVSPLHSCFSAPRPLLYLQQHSKQAFLCSRYCLLQACQTKTRLDVASRILSSVRSDRRQCHIPPCCCSRSGQQITTRRTQVSRYGACSAAFYIGRNWR